MEMIKKFFCHSVLLFPITLLLIAFTVCGFCPVKDSVNAPEGTESRETVCVERTVGAFTGLKSNGAIPITFIQSNTRKVVVECAQEFLDKLVTEVKAGILDIYMKRGEYRYHDVRVTVYSPVLDEVSMSGSGSFTDKNGHKSSGNIRIAMSGSGATTLGDIECKNFIYHDAGSGNMTTERLDCEDAELRSSGSGSITVKNLFSKKSASLHLSGSGFGLLDQVDIEDSLDIAISGSGSIKVNGQVETVSVAISGSGSVMGDLNYKHIDSRVSGSGKIRF